MKSAKIQEDMLLKLLLNDENKFRLLYNNFPLNNKIIIITEMLFKNLLEASNDIGDNHLI